ncbi:MAG: carboxypeptidase regulatory-like domain-containing protein [Myxococcaceae bacterium]
MKRAALVAVVVAGALALWWWLRAPGPGPAASGVRPEPDRQLASGSRRAFAVTVPFDAGAEGAAQAPARACVEGKVVDVVSGQGVGGVQLVFRAGAAPRTVHTDDAGAFRIEDEGMLELASVTPPPGWFPLEGRLLSLRPGPGQCVSGLVFPLFPQRKWVGHVSDERDQPIVGAEVRVLDEDRALPSSPLLTGADGTFTFFPREGASLLVSQPGFEREVVRLGATEAITREVFITLRRRSPDAGRAASITLEGRVELNGAPAANASVIAEARGRTGGWDVVGGATADGAGRFSLDVDGPGPWRLAALEPAPGSESVQTQGEFTVLHVRGAARVVGHVRDRRGGVVSSFVISLSRRDGLASTPEGTFPFVDPAGAFRIDDAPEGKLVVTASAPLYASSDEVAVQLTAGAEANVELVLEEGGRLEGVVVDRRSGAPLPGAVVSTEGLPAALMLATSRATTDADGGFVLDGLAGGRRSVLAVADRHHARLVTTTITPGQTAHARLLLTPLQDQEAPRLELVGIGAVLEAKGDALVVTRVVPGGGAAEAGLVAGDAILSIEGQLAGNLGFVGGVELIRGEEDTTVLLSVRRADGSLVDVRAPRRVIPAP